MIFWVVIGLWLCLFSCIHSQGVILPNEVCKLRKTLVTVDEQYKFYPLVISLNRCTGVCGQDPPMFKKCISTLSREIPVNVYNKFMVRNETLNFQEDKECGCTCTHDSSVCNPETQKWDSQNCRCECRASPSLTFTCPPHYKWDPGSCSCVCDRICFRKMVLNTSDCSCTCKPYYYRKCADRQKLVNESSCKCYSPEPLTGSADCKVLPTKWAALLITISFAAFFVFAFDCIMYSRKTGCLYSVCTMLIKNKKETPLQAAIKKSHSKDTLQSNI